MSTDKRAAILTLIATHTKPLRVIAAATTPPGGAKYQRRLRLWSADCAARAVHLLAEHPADYQLATSAIDAARRYANGLTDATCLKLFYCPISSQLYQQVKATTFSIVAEVRLAAVLCAQADIWHPAMACTQFARSAIMKAVRHQHDYIIADGEHELDWQVRRLGRWLSSVEPPVWPISPLAPPPSRNAQPAPSAPL